MKRTVLLLIVAGLLVACGGAAATPHPTYTPYPTHTPYPTPTPVPTATPTPTSKVDAQDAAYLSAWQDEVEYHHGSALDLLEDMAQASARLDTAQLCQTADSFLNACLTLSLKLEALPSPKHRYLMNSYSSYKESVESWGAAALAIQEFCDTEDISRLDIGTSLMSKGAQEMEAATEWAYRYQQEIR